MPLHDGIISAVAGISLLVVEIIGMFEAFVHYFNMHKIENHPIPQVPLEEYPDVEFFFIAGADSIMDIEKWYHPEYVLPAVTFLAAAREHEEADRSLDEQISYLTQKYQAHILRLHCREMDVASAEIRAAFRAGHAADVRSLVPKEVCQYIEQHGLYQEVNV